MTVKAKEQPWFHSWYGDILGLHLVPLVFSFLAIMHWPPFSSGQPVLKYLLGLIIIIDWGHIFAQWPRIFSNPLESSRNKIGYIVLYLCSIGILAIYLHYGHQPYVDLVLIYFVIFHFIKQQFGLIKIYSKTDGPKTKIQNRLENLFIYLSMVVPLIYWHIDFPLKDFYWIQYFFKSDYFTNLFQVTLALYVLSFAAFVYFEFMRTKQNRFFNVPKNMAILATAMGWGIVSIAIDAPQLVFFTVVLTHDLSYTFLVWITARRDKVLQHGKVAWVSWFSVPGLLAFMIVLVAMSQLVLLIFSEMAKNVNINHFIFGTLFNHEPFEERWIRSLGWAIFFGTQAHHYFIDRFLWKKEKDYAYMKHTGRLGVSE